MPGKKMIPLLLTLLQLISCCRNASAENGYDLWLRYVRIPDPNLLTHYRQQITGWMISGQSPTLQAAKEELAKGLEGLLGKAIPEQASAKRNMIIAGTPASSSLIASSSFTKKLQQAGPEGYFITHQNLPTGKSIIIAANTDVGVLYGVFHVLRLLQTQQSIDPLSISASPKTQLRLLNHWDNPDRSVERGYAGLSLWNWHTLPSYIDQRYKDYARANASISINGAVLTNVNANATILSTAWLEKAAALANVFRPYGIRVYLTARFSAPVEGGGLKTADPLDPAVQEWWQAKAREIYSLIPDFGGFLVKANSEGQPGPQHYGRNHADGANMLARAVAPFKGHVIWRAFVYSHEVPDDRHKQAYNEFVPLDGKFDRNVMVQVKNGAIDFQPREPFHPLFGAMPQTPLMMEFQLTQEYLGFSTHLVYLAPLFKECLEADTYRKGPGTTVAKVIDGSAHAYSITGMAGVANTGNDMNWCGHPFAQANWYAFGRLAWDHQLGSDEMADEWLRMTFSNHPSFVKPVKKMMLDSREITVGYMTPLGLHHIMGSSHHYGPAPWVSKAPRPDWTNIYYHKADPAGIGFNRTASGSNALSQYTPPVQQQWSNPGTCDDKFLLWFHHLAWTYTLKSGRTLWEELCYRYYTAADSVKGMQQTWQSVRPFIDQQRYEQVRMLLQIQQQEAVWWRDACLLYFQTLSNMPLPAGYEPSQHSLEYYKNLSFRYAPGI